MSSPALRYALETDRRQFALEHDVAAVATVQQDPVPVRVPVIRAEPTLDAHPVHEMFAAMLGVDSIVCGARRSVPA